MTYDPTSLRVRSRRVDAAISYRKPGWPNSATQMRLYGYAAAAAGAEFVKEEFVLHFLNREYHLLQRLGFQQVCQSTCIC